MEGTAIVLFFALGGLAAIVLIHDLIFGRKDDDPFDPRGGRA